MSEASVLELFSILGLETEEKRKELLALENLGQTESDEVVGKYKTYASDNVSDLGRDSEYAGLEGTH